jgi:hypothetical protein
MYLDYLIESMDARFNQRLIDVMPLEGLILANLNMYDDLNLEIFTYFSNILVTVELYGLRVSITIKEREKDRRASAPSVFSFKLRP